MLLLFDYPILSPSLGQLCLMDIVDAESTLFFSAQRVTIFLNQNGECTFFDDVLAELLTFCINCVTHSIQVQILLLIDQKMNIKHIPIPFDELELFQEEEKYQNYLIQTLIYSTKVYIHRNNSKNKYIFVLTKRNMIAEQDNKTKNKIIIPINSILEIIKSEDHPQLVLSTEDNYDNLRISANNQDRCQHIISAIAFYFTYLSPKKKPIRLYRIKQNSLLYFQRTSKQKRTAPKLSLERYPYQEVDYVAAKDSPDIFGKLIIQKIQLVKLINSQNSHLCHIAKVNQNQQYICHTLDKNQLFVDALKGHTNVDHICKLLYARSLQYKTQLFFEPMPFLKLNEVDIVQIFQQLFKLYDEVIAYDKNLYLSPHMVCHQNQNKKLFLRQYRYKELRFDDDYQRFLYKKISNEKDENEAFMNKIYNIGMLLYYFIFGRPLFEHEDLQISIYLKQNIKEINFPSHLRVPCSKKMKSFIENSILGKITNKVEMMQHPWIKQNLIQL